MGNFESRSHPLDPVSYSVIWAFDLDSKTDRVLEITYSNRPKDEPMPTDFNKPIRVEDIPYTNMKRPVYSKFYKSDIADLLKENWEKKDSDDPKYTKVYKCAHFLATDFISKMCHGIVNTNLMPLFIEVCIALMKSKAENVDEDVYLDKIITNKPQKLERMVELIKEYVTIFYRNEKNECLK
jgi:hypothetical protein